MNRQIRRLGIALMLMFCALVIQLTNLQLVQGEHLANHPGNTRIATKRFNEPRGIIRSADGTVLARSRVVRGGVFQRLREYPQGELFGHITGYLSFTYGIEGVERTYDDDLAGRNLNITKLGDLFTDQVQTNDITLTIHKDLQQTAKDALGKRKGSVVALDPSDGSVLALWSYPSYDPSPLAGHTQSKVKSSMDSLRASANKPMLPRSFRETYAPGSTFKVVTAAATLERNPKLANKSYPTLRELKLPQTDRTLANFGRGSCGGRLPQILKVSCNTAFAQMGLDLGADALSAEAEDFGFNKKTPLDLPAVSPSIFPDSSSFVRDLPALAQSAIGQRNVRTTPLQMALVAAAVANQGDIMVPHVLKEVRNSEGEVVRTARARTLSRVMSTDAASTLRDIMVTVVESGTATRAKIPGVKVGGKTGTAQTEGDNAHVWFIAFAPADDPKIAIAVMVESQPGVGEATGGRVAAQIAKAVIEKALSLP